MSAEDPVEAVVGEGERGGASTDGLGGVSGAGLVEEFFDEVEADDMGVGEGLLDVPGDVAGTAAYVEEGGGAVDLVGYGEHGVGPREGLFVALKGAVAMDVVPVGLGFDVVGMGGVH